MDKRTVRFFAAGSALIIALTAALLIVNLSMATPTAAIVSGVVTFPDGTIPSVTQTLPPGTFVWLMRPDEWPPTIPDPIIHGKSWVVTDTGAFSFAGVAPGGYLVRAVPPSLSPFTPSDIMPVHVLTAPLILPPIRLTTPSITGTVYAPGGITPTNATVLVFAGPTLVERRFTVEGNFAIGGLPTGTYKLVAEPRADDPYWRSAPITAALAPAAPQYVTLTLKPVQIHGIVLEGPGLAPPVPEARVHAIAANGVHRVDVTGALGKFALGDLPTGMTATLVVEPPAGRGDLLPPPPQVITLPHTTPFVSRFDVPPKWIHGGVRTNTGISVTGALIEAHRVDRYGHAMTWTNASGLYGLRLAPGVWAINVKSISSTVPSHWVYPYPAQLVRFENNTAPEHKLINMVVLTADATVAGAVELPDHSPPPFTVTASLRTDEGVGLSQQVDADGRFTFTVPHGVYKLDLHVESASFAAPPPTPIRAPAIVPTITLIPRDAIITGTLTEESSGLPVENVPVIAWNLATGAMFGARSGPDGMYITPVYSGTWLVRPAPRPDQPYVFTGAPLNVAIASGQVAGSVDLTLLAADATINGVLVDGSSHPVPSAYGWAAAVSEDRTVRTGAPVEAGEFSMMVPAGAYSVTVHLPGTQPFMSDGQPELAIVAAGDATTVTFTLILKTSKIRGAVWDKRANVSVDVDGQVWAWDNGLRTGTDIKPGGLYTLPIPAGDWSVNYAIDPHSNYLKAAGPRTYAVPAGARVDVPLPVVEKDSTLTGTVLMPNGAPAAGAVVIAEASSPDITELTVRSRPTRSDGRFIINLPSGQYNVRSAMIHDPGLINPVIKAVNIPRHGSNSITLQYRRPDAAITGTVTLVTGTLGLPGIVHLWAWSASDGYNATIAPLGGVYTLPVTGGEDWNVVAVLELPNRYWIARTVVSVPVSATVNHDLELQGPKLKPAPVTVVFDSTQSQLIELEDGTRIFIPAGAMPVEGRIILHITPLAAVPHHHYGDVVGLSYVFEAFTEDGQPITSNFNQDVVITFKYDPAELAARGINVNRLRPAYFSTTTNRWTVPDSFVVDEIRREITLQINHFTQFGVLNTPEIAMHTIFLPLVLKNG